ncbi:MAG TPA: RIP metalloprotease RseP [Gammaproteobacteria bacterium]|nr:RIP metalloprotease RseP [Gammaproteobacteria bacterium]
MQILISILAYVAAVGILVTIHEFGHFIVARRLGIKVLRFSIGFGKPLYTWRRKGDETEYVLAAIPLGGYVKMSDEREGAVQEADLPRAFNRQSIPRRVAVVVAGPAFNLLLAVIAYWIIFMAGVTSLKPVVGYVSPDSIAAKAGMRSGDQILSVAGDATATWDDVQLDLFREVLRSPDISLTVQGADGRRQVQLAIVDPQKLTEPNQMLSGLGLSVVPQTPVVAQVAAGDAAAKAGLKVGDRIVSMDGKPVQSWLEVVQILRASAGKALALVISRGGKTQELTLKVGSIAENGATVGHVGVAGPLVPTGFFDGLKVEQRYNPLAALGQGLARTAEMSWLTLVAGWNMLIGNVSLKNLSGPIDIAQYAGYAAEGGVTSFLEFLAFVSISLGVLNLLPIPVLDGGHLLYFVAEGVKGSPLSERTEALGQKVGIMLLLALMGFAVCNDLIRVFS